ncbi:GspH/FimT family pseudopilin [Caldimonas sp. KR1-144]|uniref:GspH/FimT family pseudopilin n=1 Tax=Caldimonas sp. KR1-144 TaxID=3400911 RepID=UPI003BFF747D
MFKQQKGAQSSLRAYAQRGVTLIEACACLAIIAILVGSATPSFIDMLTLRKLEGRSAELTTDLQWLRTEALARNASLRIEVLSDADGACYIVHDGDANACTCNGEGPAKCTPGVTAAKSVQLPAAERITLRSNVRSMVYDPRFGTTSPGGGFELADSQGRTVRHVVNIMGRVRTCTPSGNVAGLKPC